VDRQLAAMREGNVQAAYAETSQSFRQSTSIEEFERFVAANPIITTITGHSFPQRRVENGVGYLTGSLTTDSGGVQPVGYRLVKENDEWKILSITFNPQTDN